MGVESECPSYCAQDTFYVGTLKGPIGIPHGGWCWPNADADIARQSGAGEVDANCVAAGEHAGLPLLGRRERCAINATVDRVLAFTSV
jgi:hypothetical protein